MNNIHVRSMTAEDIPGADALRELAGWNQTRADWRRFLDLEPEGCFVAASSSEIAGVVTSVRHGEGVAWIGMMLVHPDLRRQGLGSQLMKRALEYLRAGNVETIKLDATPAGRPVYEKLGFIEESALARWELAPASNAAPVSPADPQVRPMQQQDWPDIEELDAQAFGAPRPRLLPSLAASAQALLVSGTGDQFRGWGLLRSGARADYLGPVVCKSGASVLIRSLLARAGSRPIFWDILDRNLAAAELARELGFAPVRPLTRMRIGPPLKGDASMTFAIADPAWG